MALKNLHIFPQILDISPFQDDADQLDDSVHDDDDLDQDEHEDDQHDEDDSDAEIEVNVLEIECSETTEISIISHRYKTNSI